ncbi:MAG TPA: oligopeptide/dipeptide ABC transporter ATP-binding protein, partial [Chlamydiales bacterium]|nr:oligopeptide/dipeptide ABC transporter ATP-binding protein [Chlamydiales bacterium]
ITHDMGVVAEMADQVAVMYAGEIVEFGPVEAVFATPLHPYTQALFASRTTRAMRKKPLTVIAGSAPAVGHKPEGCPFHTRCPFVMDKCKKGAVDTFYAKGRQDHWAKCWLLEK